jgi:hypothetical protein
MNKRKEIIHLGNMNKCDTCFNLGYNKARNEVEKMINKIKLTNPDYSYSNDYIDDFLVELKQQIRKLK